MSQTVVIETQPRTATGSQAARRFRKQGLVPAVLYGHEEATVSFTLSGEEIEKAIRQGSHVVDLKSNGNTQRALIREIQWDFLGKDLLHIDFYRIRAGERVEVTVSIELKGTAPGATGDAILEQPMHQLHIECPADAIPDVIKISVSKLQVNDAIHVKDLALPEGVKPLAEEDAVVVHVVMKQVEEEEETGLPGADAGAEPERIGRQKPAEEEE